MLCIFKELLELTLYPLEVALAHLDMIRKLVGKVHQRQRLVSHGMKLLDFVDNFMAPTQDPCNSFHLFNVALIELHALLQKVLDIFGQIGSKVFEAASSVDQLHYSTRVC